MTIVDCDVRDCVFTGLFDTLIIDGRGHAYPVDPAGFSADFSQAIFRNTSITGYMLDRVALPHQPDLVVIREYPQVLRDAASWLSRNIDTDAGVRAMHFLEAQVKSPGHEDSDLSFDLGASVEEPEFTSAVTQALTNVQQKPDGPVQG